MLYQACMAVVAILVFHRRRRRRLVIVVVVVVGDSTRLGAMALAMLNMKKETLGSRERAC